LKKPASAVVAITKLTTKGEKMLEAQHSTWANLVNAIRLITEAENA
jgi:hypothetical protein